MADLTDETKAILGLFDTGPSSARKSSSQEQANDLNLPTDTRTLPVSPSRAELPSAAPSTSVPSPQLPAQSPQGSAPQLTDETKSLLGLLDAPVIEELTPEVEKPSLILGEFAGGLDANIQNLAADYTALAALVTDVTGFDETSEELAASALHRIEDITASNPRTVERFVDIEGTEDFIRYTARALGENTATIASIVAGGGIGGLLGRVAGKAALGRTMTMAVAKKLTRRGTQIGAFAAASGLETGATTIEQLESVGKISPGVALTAGLAKGALESIVPLALGVRLGLTASAASGLTSSIIRAFSQVVPTRLAAATTTGATELVTETLQEVIDIGARKYVDENFEVLGQETADRLIESAAAGGLVGFIFGGVFGGGGRRRASGEDNEALVLRNRDGSPLAGPEVNVTSGKTTGKVSGTATATIGEQLSPLVADFDQDRSAGEINAPYLTVTSVAGQVPLVPSPASTGPVFVDSPSTSNVASPVLHFGEQRGFIFDNRVNSAKSVALSKAPSSEVRVQSANATDFAPQNISALFENVTKESTVIFLNPETQVEAKAMLDEAIETRNSDRYFQALSLGARVSPEGKNGFIAFAESADGLGEEVGLDRASAVEGEVEEGFVQVSLNDTSIELGDSGSFLSENTVSQKQNVAVVNKKDIEKTATKVSADPEQLQFLLRKTFGLELIIDTRLLDALVQDPTNTVQYRKELLGEEKERAAKLLERLHVTGLSLTPEQKHNLLLRIYNYITFTSEQGPQGYLLDPAASLPLSSKPAVSFPSLEARQPKIPLKDIGRLDFKIEQNVPLLFGTQEKYSRETHKEGEVVLISTEENVEDLSSLDRRQIKQVQKYLQRMMKLFGKKSRIILTVNDSLFQKYKHAAGFYDTFSDLQNPSTEIHIININLTAIRKSISGKQKFSSSARSLALIITTASHEFGHFLVRTTFANASPGVQQKILSAYNRDLIRGNFGVPGSFTANRFNVGQQSFLEGAKEETSAPDFLENQNYWYNMDEFLAEQIAKWATTDKVPLDLVEKFFKNITKLLKKMLRETSLFLNLPSATFKPEPEIQAWIESLISRKDNPELFPLSFTAVFNGEFKSIKENTAILSDFNTGEFVAPNQANTENIQILFSKLGIPKAKAKEIRAYQDKYSLFSKWMLTIQQMALRNPHIKQLGNYVELIEQWYNYKMKLVSRADERVQEMLNMGEENLDNLAKFILEIEEMVYRTPEEIEANVERHPTNDEIIALAKKHHLTQFGLDTFVAIREDFNFVLDEIASTSRRDIERTFTDEAVIVRELNKLEADMNKLRNRPYFPHARFGQFAVVVKDSKNKTAYMEQFDSRRQAALAVKRIQAKFTQQDGHRIAVRKLPEEVLPFRGIPASLLKSMRTTLKLTVKQKEWLDLLIVELAPSASFRKHLARRENVPGFSEDILRAYASYFFHSSNYLARIRFGPDLQEAVDTISEETSAFEGVTDTTKRDSIRDMMQHHLSHIMNPGPDWAALRSIAFQWWLGFSPASAVLNFTQIPLVALPYLSARFGDVNSANALRKSILSIHKIYKADIDKVSPELYKALTRAVEEAVIDESQAVELAAASGGNYVKSFVTGVQPLHRGFVRFAQYSAFMFQTSEKINRRVVFRAAWDMVMDGKISQEYRDELTVANALEIRALTKADFSEIEALAYLAGRDAVRRTQFQYAAHARPRFMHGRKGTLFTFFMFLQSMLFFTRYSPGNGRFLLMLLFMGGLMGLPGAEDLNAILKMIGRNWYGSQFDLEEEVRRFVVDATDGTIPPDLFLKGASRVGFGIPAAMDALGLPMSGFDMSSNIGLGQVIPGVAQLGRPGVEFDARAASIATDTAGAAFGIGINIIQAMTDDSYPIDDMKRWERAMPRALRNLHKAARFYNEGRERTRTGTTILEFNKNDPYQMSEIIAQGLGFSPTRLSRKWDRLRMEQEATIYWRVRRQLLMSAFDRALVTDDKPGKKDVISDIRTYNNEVPFNEMGISNKELGQSMQARKQSRLLQERGIAKSLRERRLVKDVQSLFPEVTIEDARKMK